MKVSGESIQINASRRDADQQHVAELAESIRELELLSYTWRGNPCFLAAALLSSMALFLKTYATELDDNHFIRRLSVIDPDEIIRRGRLDYNTSNNFLRYACVSIGKIQWHTQDE